MINKDPLSMAFSTEVVILDEKDYEQIMNRVLFDFDVNISNVMAVKSGNVRTMCNRVIVHYRNSPVKTDPKPINIEQANYFAQRYFRRRYLERIKETNVTLNKIKRILGNLK